MSDLFNERVVPVPPRSTNSIVEEAEEVLKEIAPKRLKSPGPLNVVKHLEYSIPSELDIHVQPVEASEIPGDEARTVTRGEPGDPVDVLIREDVWGDLLKGGSDANRPKVTAIHEVGHAKIHVNFIRENRADASARDDSVIFSRKARRDLKAYRDPEWQSYTFAGALLAPVSAIEQVLDDRPNCTVGQLARVFRISNDMMRSHLKRLGIPRKK